MNWRLTVSDGGKILYFADYSCWQEACEEAIAWIRDSLPSCSYLEIKIVPIRNEDEEDD